MPIKIDAPRADGQHRDDGKLLGEAMPHDAHCPGWNIRVHVIRATDLRKLMALWRAAEYDMDNVAGGIKTGCMSTREALDALRRKKRCRTKLRTGCA